MHQEMWLPSIIFVIAHMLSKPLKRASQVWRIVLPVSVGYTPASRPPKQTTQATWELNRKCHWQNLGSFLQWCSVKLNESSHLVFIAKATCVLTCLIAALRTPGEEVVDLVHVHSPSSAAVVITRATTCKRILTLCTSHSIAIHVALTKAFYIFWIACSWVCPFVNPWGPI